METKENLKEEVRKKEDKAAKKRKQLMSSAQRLSHWRTRLNFTAAMLALVSGGTIVAVVADFAGDQGAQVLAAAIAFVSGVISLSITWFYPEKDSQRMLDGANDFLKLQISAQQLQNNANLSEKELTKGLAKLQDTYVKLDKDYGAFNPKNES